MIWTAKGGQEGQDLLPVVSEAQFILDVEGLGIGSSYESQRRDGLGEVHDDCFVDAAKASLARFLL